VRNRILLPSFTLAALLVFSSAALAQKPEDIPEGWKTCPHCLTPQQQRDLAKLDPPGKPFNAHQLDGVWSAVPSKGPIVIETVHDAFGKDQNSTGVKPPEVPDLTPYGKELFKKTITEYKSPEGTRVTNSRDPMLICDPLGWPRWFSYNYGFEFVTLPDRTLQFIEWAHTWRTIWTDGRKLPANPPQPRFLGYAVGHWEGDTFVVESNGYDDRSWISEAGNYAVKPGAKGWGMSGWPHSDEMRISERWKRTTYGTMEAVMTITDPKVYTKPWTTQPTKHVLNPNAELWEYFCVPSDSNEYNERIMKPSNGVKK